MRRFHWLLGLALATSFPSGVSLAGHEVGNGGDAIVCRSPDNGIRTAELLDIYEARELRRIPMNLVSFEMNAKIEEALLRLARFSPLRAARYREQIRTFFAEALFVKDVELYDIPDSDDLFFPLGCKPEQLVIQIKPYFPEDPRYVVNQNIWDALDANSRATMLLHEVIYREAIENGHENSRATRYYNSMLFSGRVENFSLENYVGLMQLLRLPFDYKRPETR